MIDDEERQKVTILLAEYNTLRAEIIARIGHAYQLIGFGVTALALFVIGQPPPFIFWPMLAFVLTIFAFALWVYWRDISKCGQRIREIELDVNDRAQEDLLIRENLWGAGVVGNIGPGEPLPRSHLGSSLTRPTRTWRGKEIQTNSPTERVAE